MKTGTNAAWSAASANRLRTRFGTWKAIVNADIAAADAEVAGGDDLAHQPGDARGGRSRSRRRRSSGRGARPGSSVAVAVSSSPAVLGPTAIVGRRRAVRALRPVWLSVIATRSAIAVAAAEHGQHRLTEEADRSAPSASATRTGAYERGQDPLPAARGGGRRPATPTRSTTEHRARLADRQGRPEGRAALEHRRPQEVPRRPHRAPARSRLATAAALRRRGARRASAPRSRRSRSRRGVHHSRSATRAIAARSSSGLTPATADQHLRRVGVHRQRRLDLAAASGPPRARSRAWCALRSRVATGRSIRVQRLALASSRSAIRSAAPRSRSTIASASAQTAVLGGVGDHRLEVRDADAPALARPERQPVELGAQADGPAPMPLDQQPGGVGLERRSRGAGASATSQPGRSRCLRRREGEHLAARRLRPPRRASSAPSLRRLLAGDQDDREVGRQRGEASATGSDVSRSSARPRRRAGSGASAISEIAGIDAEQGVGVGRRGRPAPARRPRAPRRRPRARRGRAGGRARASIFASSVPAIR